MAVYPETDRDSSGPFQTCGRQPLTTLEGLTHHASGFMTFPPAPNFNPDDKRNQHYVPQLWQQRFANDSGRVYVRYRVEADPIRETKPRRAGKARQVSVADTMASDWIYTIFGRWWRHTSALEGRNLKMGRRHRLRLRQRRRLRPAGYPRFDATFAAPWVSRLAGRLR